MNKTLLAVAVSAAMVASTAAMAGDVTVYGQAQVEIASYSEDSTGSGKDGVSVEDNARGRVGLKATEDLGNGMKAFAQFEWKADTTDNNVGKCSASSVSQTGLTGTGAALLNASTITSTTCSSSVALTGRVAQVGLQGGFGSVAFGNLKSPYKYTGGVKYDPFVTTSMQARGNGGMTGGNLGHNSFVNDTMLYSSPKGPITGSIGYGAEENDGLVMLDVKYSQGGIEAFVAYIDAGDRISGGVSGDKSSYAATKVGGQWKAGAHKLSAQYEMVEAKGFGGAKAEPQVYFLGYQFGMGKNTFAASYGDTDLDIAGVDNITYMALGIIHKMSKQTRVFAGYRDTSDVESVVTVGLRKDFKS